MPHTMPTPIDLNDQLYRLRKDYITERGDIKRKDRKEMIDLVMSFQSIPGEKYNHYAALGVCLYGLLKVEEEYFAFNSKLQSLLKKCLNISTVKELSDYEAFVYLFHLYEHLRKYPRTNEGKNTGRMEDMRPLLHNIENYLKKYKESILKSSPTYQCLKKNFLCVAEEYKPGRGWFGFGTPDPSRDIDVKRIRAVDELLNQAFPQESKDERIQERVYKIRYGALIYLMAKIEYSYYLRSPENSELYQLCQRTACLKHTALLTETAKNAYFNEFLGFVSSVQYHSVWTNAGLETPKAIDKQWKKMYAKSHLQRYTFYLMDHGVQYGVQIGVGTVTAAMLSQFKLTSVVISSAGKLLTPEYALVMNKLGPFLGSQINSCVVSVIAGTVSQILIEPIGKPMILITFGSIQSLIGFLTSISRSKKNMVIQNLYDVPEFHKILGEMPETIISAKEKEKIGQIVGYEKLKKSEITLQTAMHFDVTKKINKIA